MDCLENENVCSVPKENNTGYYRIHTIWGSDGVKVNVTSKNGAWTGEVSHRRSIVLSKMTPENIDNKCKELHIDRDKYLSECREALTTSNGKPNYSYAVEYGTFVWKKTIDEDSGMKIEMGSVVLRHADFVDTIQGIVEASLRCNQNLKNQLHSMTQQNASNLCRVHEFKEKLKELTDKKIQMEADLYKKFLLLLNTKKRKIQELEELVGKSKCSASESKKGAEDVQIGASVKGIDPFDVETDDDEECGPSSIPSTSKHVIQRDSKMKIIDNSSIELNKTEPEKRRDKSPNLLDESNSREGPNKAFPSTKTDILDFFFGIKDSD